MKFDNFDWDDIIFEAPNEPEEADDGLSATDYNDTENLDVDEVSEEEDLGAEDYTEMENEDGGEEGMDEEPSEGGLDEEGDGEEMDEEGMGEEGEDDSLDDEQQDNVENDPQGQQNKYLAHDFIELYNRQQEIIDKIRGDKRLNAFTNPTTHRVKKNLEKLSQVTYDYIIDKFSKESYVANLYQFNLIIQAMNVNVQMLEEVNERMLKEEEKLAKSKKRKTKK